MAVAVTGMGAVCAAGIDVPQVWASAVEGRARASWFEEAGAAVYRVPGEFPLNAPGIQLHRADRCVRLAVMAAMQAAAGAELGARPVPPERLGVFIGTARGALGTWSSAVRRASQGKRQHPSLMVQGSIASLSGTLSVLFGAQGPCLTVAAACASGANAIALAAEQIESGAIDAAIVGGADAPLEAPLIEQFRAAGLLGTHADPARACRPFDRTRDGTALGEGAGILVLESLASARLRGVRAQALLAGWGLTSDAGGRASIDEGGHGLRRAIESALARSGLDRADVGYINAHGTGTKQNDLHESAAIASVFGPGAACSSTKPVTGHCAGASPAIEAILTVRAMQEGVMPPTATCESPDPDCPIDPLSGRARAGDIRAVLSNSLGIWGVNAALVFRRSAD